MPPRRKATGAGVVGRPRVVTAVKPAGGRASKAMTLSERFQQISKVGPTGIGKRRQVVASTQQANRQAKQASARKQAPAKPAQAGKAKAKAGKGKGRAKAEPAQPPSKDALDGDMDSYFAGAAAGAATTAADADVLAGVPDSVVPDTDAAMTTA